jgi:hypothetical protein
VSMPAGLIVLSGQLAHVAITDGAGDVGQADDSRGGCAADPPVYRGDLGAAMPVQSATGRFISQPLWPVTCSNVPGAGPLRCGVETVRLGTRELDEIGVVVSVGGLDEGCDISCSA